MLLVKGQAGRETHGQGRAKSQEPLGAGGGGVVPGVLREGLELAVGSRLVKRKSEGCQLQVKAGGHRPVKAGLERQEGQAVNVEALGDMGRTRESSACR